MRQLLRNFFIFLFTFLMIGCGKSEDDFGFITLDLDITGAYVRKITRSGWEVSIPKSGGSFTVEEIDGLELGSSLSIVSDEWEGKTYHFKRPDGTAPILETNEAWPSDKWWKLSYLNAKPPYKVLVEIEANPEQESRVVVLQYSYGPYYSSVRVMQK